MKKTFIVTLFLLYCSVLAQNYSGKWSDLFSYNNVIAFKEKEGTLLAATENGLFYYNTVSGEIKKLSKVNGLHEVKISAFAYNPSTNVALVGYQSGNMDVVTQDGVKYIVDIPLSQSYNGSKRINHISITGNTAVISAGYGVSVFDIAKKQFGDTCFFFDGSSFEAASEAVISDNVVYAVTPSGLRYHPINVTFSVFSTWNTLPGEVAQIEAGSIFLLANKNSVRYGNLNALNRLTGSFNDIRDVKLTGSEIIITDQNRVQVYSLNGTLQRTFDFAEELNTADVIKGKLYLGTRSLGIVDESRTVIKPDGPFSNISHKIQIQDEQIWVSTGGRSARYNLPAEPFPNLGFYFFDGSKWIYPSFFKTSTEDFNILDVVPNPSNTNEVFFTNYSMRDGQGIYRFIFNKTRGDFDFGKFYRLSERNFQKRPVGLVYTSQNDLIATYAFGAGLAFYRKSEDAFADVELSSAESTQKPVDYDGKIWIPSPRQNFFIVYDYNKTFSNTQDDKMYLIERKNGLPEASDGSLSIALDKNGEAWIGTDRGLRVLSNASDAVTSGPRLEPIVITQKGLPEELFKELPILQIEADSGNQKWVSVEGGGVFYLSSNGEKTIQHFTKNNSPLPNDTVTDVKVDNKTGKVYFCTYDGIVVYQGDAVNVSSNFANVKVYPNPVVTAQFKGNVKITGLAEKTHIRITDAAGNLVHQAVARGGFYEWNLNNSRGQRVASGIYFVLMTNEDATDKATAKIAVVN